MTPRPWKTRPRSCRSELHAADRGEDRPLRRRLFVASLFAAALLATTWAGRAAAVDPIIGIPIPHEAAPIADFAPISDAVVVDLDGDGVRELLTLRAADGNQDVVAVQATWVSDNGVAQSSNQVLLLRPEGEHLLPVTIEDVAHLLLVHRAGAIVPLVATTGLPGACCLSVWEVQAIGHRLALRLVADTQRTGMEMVGADMDGDGTDELVVAEGSDEDVGFILAVGVLRWDGDRLVRIGTSISSIGVSNASILDAGDSDGEPGEEVLVTGPSTNGPHSVYRISLRTGGLFVERAESADAALVVARERGPVIVASYQGGPLEVWTWPRDEEPQRLRLSGDGSIPMAVLAALDETGLFLGVPGGTPSGPTQIGSVRIFGGNTDDGASREIRSDERAVGFLDASPAIAGRARDDVGFPAPYVGAMLSGISDLSDGFVFAGLLLRPDPGPNRLVTTKGVALLPGLEPVGTVGTDGAWMAVLPRRDTFHLNETGPDHPVVEMRYGTYWLDGDLRLVSTASVLQPEENAGQLTPTFRGVAPSPRGQEELLVRDDAVEADIVGPPGTTVGWWTDGTAERGVIGPQGSIHVPLLPRFGADAPDGTTVSASLWAVTPAGHGYSGIWQITVDRQPPGLDVRGQAPFIDLDPTVVGQTDPGTAVTVNGDPVTVASDGSFDAPVEVGLIPTGLRVAAVDPLGNRAEVVVSRVWPLDYRQLPFVPLAALATIAAAAVLYLRRPDSGPDHRRPNDGVTIEEIGD